MLPEEEVRKILEGKAVLIIEDDVGLSKRLKQEFNLYGGVVDIRHYIDSGIEELRRNGLHYNLVIIDVMLPQTESEFNQIQECRKEVENYDQVLIREDEVDPTNEKFKKELEDARRKREFLLKQMSSLINNHGGIEMIQNWIIGGLAEGERHNRPAILYLTAVGNEESCNEGRKAAEDKNVEWLVKPVTSHKLMNTAAELLK